MFFFPHLLRNLHFRVLDCVISCLLALHQRKERTGESITNYQQADSLKPFTPCMIVLGRKRNTHFVYFTSTWNPHTVYINCCASMWLFSGCNWWELKMVSVTPESTLQRNTHTDVLFYLGGSHKCHKHYYNLINLYLSLWLIIYSYLSCLVIKCNLLNFTSLSKVCPLPWFLFCDFIMLIAVVHVINLKSVL